MAMIMLAAPLGEICVFFIEQSRTWQRISARVRSSTHIQRPPGLESLEDSAQSGLENLGAQESEVGIINGGGNITGASNGEIRSGSDRRRDAGVQVSGVGQDIITQTSVLVDATTQTDENIAIFVDVTTQTDQHSTQA